MLADLSRRRANQGFSPSETATFVFSLKQPLFDRILTTSGNDPKLLANQIWSATTLLDKLGLYTAETFQKSREEFISRQQNEMLELYSGISKENPVLKPTGLDESLALAFENLAEAIGESAAVVDARIWSETRSSTALPSAQSA